jgi:hypothetical protein
VTDLTATARGLRTQMDQVETVQGTGFPAPIPAATASAVAFDLAGDRRGDSVESSSNVA